MASNEAARFLGRLSLEAELGSTLSDTRIRLLEEIDRTGSINQAAKAVPLSYKAAWDAVDTLNNLSMQPLVARTGGGKRGGTHLTDYGRRMVAMYRALEAEMQTALQKLQPQLVDDGFDTAEDFRRLLRRLAFRNSARNHFAGPVIALQDGVVNSEVTIRVGEETEIVSIITKASVENLALAPGKEVVALVKASSVLIAVPGEGAARLSARNQLWGEIETIHAGPVNDEVTLLLPSGKRITAVVTHESSRQLALTVGMRACAFFKASSVIVSVCD